MNENDEMESACRKTVAKAMQEMGLKSRIRKTFKPKTTEVDPSKKPAKNLLDQVFTAEAPNQKWVTDITYLATSGGWVYLACVLDLFSRKIVVWSISNSLETSLVSKALQNAIHSRRPDTTQLLHHSDRGCQYTSDEYRGILKRLGITVSMSHVGYCYDNAVMERFFWSLKHEWTNHDEYADLEEARLSVFKYIETFYNNQRIHQTLDYKTPNQFEANFQQNIAVWIYTISVSARDGLTQSGSWVLTLVSQTLEQFESARSLGSSETQDRSAVLTLLYFWSRTFRI